MLYLGKTYYISIFCSFIMENNFGCTNTKYRNNEPDDFMLYLGEIYYIPIFLQFLLLGNNFFGCTNTKLPWTRDIFPYLGKMAKLTHSLFLWWMQGKQRIGLYY